MFKILAFAALSAAAVIVLLPRGNDVIRTAAPSTTGAEASLIASLREMAKPPKDVPALDLHRYEPAPTVVAYVEPVDLPSPRKQRMVVTESAVNVRAEPSKSGEITGRVTAGEFVDVADRKGGWVRIATPEGTIGWAYSDFLAEEN